ncbi:hypothetical protein [Aeromicrobium sp. 179-A 4D2 NHS]|uniref:hypothetical protein n=1 Tax=Aeromicrobium sp. 179-A 4D2 NHS TaxID=3142375 RepID=UPI0039A122C6
MTVATLWLVRVSSGAPHQLVVWFFTACALWFTFSTVTEMRLQSTLGDAASKVAGRDVHVHCKQEYLGQFATGNRTGYVPYSPTDPFGTGQDVFLRQSVCDSLSSAMSDWDSSPEVAAAVQVLTHEAMHVKGEKNEATAECSAMQYMGAVAEALGADPETASSLSVVYHQMMYDRMPTEYRSGECVPGGGMDLRLGDGPW